MVDGLSVRPKTSTPLLFTLHLVFPFLSLVVRDIALPCWASLLQPSSLNGCCWMEIEILLGVAGVFRPICFICCCCKRKDKMHQRDIDPKANDIKRRTPFTKALKHKSGWFESPKAPRPISKGGHV